MADDPYHQSIDPSLVDLDLDAFHTYQETHACDVCQAKPDEYGYIEHGRGCYVVDDDGGGMSHVDPFITEP